MTQKKTSKKVKKKAKARVKLRVLAQVEDTPEINELLKSNEAKLYLTGIDRSFAKLRAFIDRETALTRHPAHPDHPKA